ncbi:hypothetical protein MRX96_034328 [Rhipicephalus microplus]
MISCHCQCQASGRLDRVIQLVMNYPSEDVCPDNRHNAIDEMFWQKRAPTCWPGNLKCHCGDKSTWRFIDISPKNNVAYRKTSVRDFDGCNANQDLDRFKGTLLQDIAKISKNQEKIISAGINSVVRLHASIKGFNIVLQEALQTTSRSDSNKEHTPIGVTYKVETMSGQPQANLLAFDQSDHHDYYASVLTCVVLKPDKYISLLHIRTVDTGRKFVHSVLIEVQHKLACFWIRVIISVSSTDSNANHQHIKVIEFQALLTTVYKMSFNMAENCNEMRMWTLRKNPSDKRSTAHEIVVFNRKFSDLPKSLFFTRYGKIAADEGRQIQSFIRDFYQQFTHVVGALRNTRGQD